MKSDMTDDQKRELTERIIRWAGTRAESHSAADEITHWWYIGGLAVAYEYGDGSFHVLNVFCLLDSRDDWALVEDEIERRWLWCNYILSLEKFFKSLDVATLRGPLYQSKLWDFRRASPLVCAQALNDVLNELVAHASPKGCDTASHAREY